MHIAVAGNIGSGKTTISNILLKAGYKVFQCDKEISNLYLVKNLQNEIKSTFENKVKNLFFKNGRINKIALSDYVFSSSMQLRKLEKIIYYYLEITKKDFLEKNTSVKNHQCINNKTGKVIKACVPMHTFGHPCRIDEIKDNHVFKDFGRFAFLQIKK